MVEIRIGDQVYGGWKSARIERGIEQIAGSFELSVSERWPGQLEPRKIRRGDRCTVMDDGETLITGWVDDARPSFDADAHEFRVTGRDATGDLVDCSAIYKTGQWSGVKLDRIVRDVCKPFDIKVAIDTDIGSAFKSFKINDGESAFECIERACRDRAVMPVSDGKGGLVLTRAKDSESIAELIEGVNILSAEGEFGMKERHSRYIVKGQDRGGDDDLEPESHTQIKAESVDEQVTRYRPLVVLAENRGSHATYKDRATWERNVRRGRSSVATVTVAGWRNPA
ncbi:MAG: phage baseplate assembly protein, partial [Pseudomonadota bacterium]